MLKQKTSEDKRKPEPHSDSVSLGPIPHCSGRTPVVGEFLGSQEVAEWLHVSLRTVANWQRRRVIPHIKIGRVVRFRRDEVEAALSAFTVQAIGSTPLSRRNSPPKSK